MTMIGKVIYYSKNVKIFVVNDYLVSRHRDKYFCSCAIKYKRKLGLDCKHIIFLKRKEQ